MSSRFYRALKSWKKEHNSKGGKGNRVDSEFMRVPKDCVSDLDDVMEEFMERYGNYKHTPRNVRLWELLDRLNEIFPPVDEN